MLAFNIKIVKTRFLLCAICLLSITPSMSQNYQALHGSAFAGSLGAANNPASIAHMPYKWDFSPFAFQLKHSTNSFKINDASLLSPSNSLAAGINSNRKHKFLANQDIKLFNTRLRLSQQSAIAFGASVRSYISASTSKVKWQESFANLRNFIDINVTNLPLSAKATGNAWVEFYGTYAQSIAINDESIINAGITLKVTKGIGGGYIKASNLDVLSGVVNGMPGYYLSSGDIEYGYSTNLDAVKGNGSFVTIRNQLLQKSFTGFAASIGAEYIIPREDDTDKENAYTYDLKIGVSLLDIGYNTYTYSANSRKAKLTNSSISDSIFQKAFEDLSAVNDLDDSLQTVAGTLSSINGNFQLFQPMRLVLSADKHLNGNFFISGEITIPLTGVLSNGRNEKIFLRDMNLFALTPRYENKIIGFYLPILFNTNKQFWIGGAVKTGPLLLGLHNWANLFGKKSLQNGGGYMALIFRPGIKRQGTQSRLNILEKKLSRKEKKRLECPVL